MNKDKTYCPICKKELVKDKNKNFYIHQCDCYKQSKFKYILQWCKSCEQFTSRRGVLDGAKCCRCAVRLQHKTMKERDPEGYAKRQAAATIKANEKMKAEGKGTWNPETHKLMEETKRKNGTDLGNKEFRKKIGCNGNSKEIIEKQKELGIGIFRNDIRNNHKPGFCVKCGKFANHRNAFGVGSECGCLAKMGFVSSFKNENDILYYFDKSARQYVPWEEYKLRFVRKRITKDVESFMQSVKSLPLFQPKHMGPADSYDINDVIQIIPTFREQYADTWNGARNAFEEYLKELNVHWFTYVKFYVNGNNQIRPLVVGKSGSLLVNANGSDVNFSMNENDGPARRFLIDEGYHWDRTKLMILKTKSEKQALYWEWYLQKQYQLFES